MKAPVLKTGRGASPSWVRIRHELPGVYTLAADLAAQPVGQLRASPPRLRGSVQAPIHQAPPQRRHKSDAEHREIACSGQLSIGRISEEAFFWTTKDLKRH